MPALADATDPDAVERALTALDGPAAASRARARGRRDADRTTGRAVTDMPPARFAAVVEFNLQSAFVTTQAVARRLVDAGPAGSIVLLSSISGVQAMPFGAPYAAAKAAILAFVRTAALELGPLGVRVNAVAPGTDPGVRVSRHRRGADSRSRCGAGASPTTSPARCSTCCRTSRDSSPDTRWWSTAARRLGPRSSTPTTCRCSCTMRTCGPACYNRVKQARETRGRNHVASHRSGRHLEEGRGAPRGRDRPDPASQPRDAPRPHEGGDGR